MKKFIAEVVPLESMKEGIAIMCLEDGRVLEKVYLLLNDNNEQVFQSYSSYCGVYDEFYSTPVSTGKYFALKFTEITNGI